MRARPFLCTLYLGFCSQKCAKSVLFPAIQASGSPAALVDGPRRALYLRVGRAAPAFRRKKDRLSANLTTQITLISRSILFYTFRNYIACAYVASYSSRFESGSPVHAPFAVKHNVRVHFAVNTACKMGAHLLWKRNAPRALLTRRTFPMPCALLARRTRSATGICRGSRRCKHTYTF